MKNTTSEIVVTVAIVFVFTAVLIIISHLDNKIIKLNDEVRTLKEENFDRYDIEDIIDQYTLEKECEEKGGNFERVMRNLNGFQFDEDRCIKTTKTNIKI